MTIIDSIDPTTGMSLGTVALATSTQELTTITDAAASAAAPFRATSRTFRAALLRRIGDDLEARREEITTVAQRETGLPEARLGGELTRTVYQARFFADVLEEGSYLEATIDHAQQTPMGPGPDLRRMLVPLGPVAVFGASNFPLAFSVPGGDTVAALAAGCPVVIKAHDSHPALSLLTFAILEQAAEAMGAPEGVLGLVFGTPAGAELVANRHIRAVGFTGSLNGGRALADIAHRRAEPIPFYGELASLNPVVLTPGAIADRSEALAEGLMTSITASGGQLCTKPGIVLVPHGAAGDGFVQEVSGRLEHVGPTTLLNERIASSFQEAAERFAAGDDFEVIVKGGREAIGGFSATPMLLQVDANVLDLDKISECFGPASVVVRYDPEALTDALEHLGGSLTATVHAGPHEDDLVSVLSDLMLPKVGRLLYEGWPTGVLVSWAQTHGGPWPSTSSQHTSVGATSIRRFLRPVTWQSAPTHVLPEELRDEFRSVPRRVDGQLTLAES